MYTCCCNYTGLKRPRGVQGNIVIVHFLCNTRVDLSSISVGCRDRASSSQLITSIHPGERRRVRSCFARAPHARSSFTFGCWAVLLAKPESGGECRCLIRRGHKSWRALTTLPARSRPPRSRNAKPPTIGITLCLVPALHRFSLHYRPLPSFRLRVEPAGALLSACPLCPPPSPLQQTPLPLHHPYCLPTTLDVGGAISPRHPAAYQSPYRLPTPYHT